MPDLIYFVNHPLFNVIFFMIVKYMTKNIPLEDPSIISLIRNIYLAAQAVILGLNYWLIAVVRKKNDQTILRYIEPGQQGWDGSTGPDQLINTTFMDYDIAEIKKGIKQSFTGIMMIAFLHLQFHYIQPLILHSIMGFKTFFMSKEARIHLWQGRTTSGELRRPFRTESPFGLFIPENRQPRIASRKERSRKVE
ncbi:inorganic phosphate transporter Pho88 [Halteromyces radiatus]|uniref:inorganic phosphate transporter Pho88 n=1 Tax=Halteromyces radiatus TaxID=101107 RepID=UPI002220B927|nr:inorganic phosphate transporter Pho88 [Halteromyces radiatus]KAI8092605.1 inorganic phosphate transporter Pho88 [Halteromyces radiatus]